MKRKYLLLLCSLLLLVPIGDFWVHNSDFATTTKYCPWSHRVGFGPWVCKVKDARNGRIVVEHAQLSDNRLELSIRQDGHTRWVQHPDGHVANFSPALDRNSIILDEGDPGLLIVNGERFPIKYVDREGKGI